jgi:hypothetical protein
MKSKTQPRKKYVVSTMAFPYTKEIEVFEDLLEDIDHERRNVMKYLALDGSNRECVYFNASVGDCRELSNFKGCEIVTPDGTFPSVEHAYVYFHIYSANLLVLDLFLVGGTFSTFVLFKKFLGEVVDDWNTNNTQKITAVNLLNVDHWQNKIRGNMVGIIAKVMGGNSSGATKIRKFLDIGKVWKKEREYSKVDDEKIWSYLLSVKYSIPAMQRVLLKTWGYDLVEFDRGAAKGSTFGGLVCKIDHKKKGLNVMGEKIQAMRCYIVLKIKKLIQK